MRESARTQDDLLKGTDETSTNVFSRHEELFVLPKNVSQKRKAKRLQSQKRRLFVESLEDRRMLAPVNFGPTPDLPNAGTGTEFTVDVGTNRWENTLQTSADSQDRIRVNIPSNMAVTDIRFNYTDVDPAFNANPDVGVAINVSSTVSSGSINWSATDPGSHELTGQNATNGYIDVLVSAGFAFPAAPWNVEMDVIQVANAQVLSSSTIPAVNAVFGQANQTVNLFPYFDDTVDADNQLVYQVTGNSSSGVVTTSSIPSSTGNLVLDFGAVGTSSITVQATNTASDNVTETFSVNVAKANTATTITSDNPDASVTGQPYTVNVDVMAAAPGSGVPTGAVNINDGTGGSCVASLSGGTGSCVITSTTAGAKTLTASYGGDGNFNASSDTEAHTVNPAATSVVITADNPDASSIGEVVNIAFALAVDAPGAGSPTGTVTIGDGVDSVTVPVSAGAVALALTTPGSRTLTATYNGDANFATSTDTEGHSVLNAIKIDGGGIDDTLIINATNSNSGSYILNGAAPVAFAGINSFIFNGLAGNDTLTVNNPSGGLFSPTGEVFFHGGSQNAGTGDLLNVNGGPLLDTVTHEFDPSSNPGNGFDGSMTAVNGSTAVINYTGLEPINDNLDTDDRVFTFTAGTETIELNIGSGGFDNSIDSDLGEIVFFNNPNDSLEINVETGGGSGADTINLAGIDSDFDADLTVNGGINDTVNVTGAIEIGGGTADLTGSSINFNAGNLETTGNVVLDTLTGAVTNTGAGTDVTADNLDIESEAGVDIDTDVNSLDVLVNAPGNVDVDETDAVTLNSIQTNNGDVDVTAGGQVTVTSVTAGGGGDVEIDATSGNILVTAISAVGDDVELDADSGSILDNNGAALNITAAGLLATASGSVGTTGDPLETDIDTLAVGDNTTLGDVAVNNTGHLTIGTVGGTSGVDSAADDVVIRATGRIDVTENVGGDTVQLVTVDAAGGGQDIILRTTRSIVSNTGDVVLQSGDNVMLEDSSTVTANSGQVDIFGDVADADPGIGSLISLLGTINSGSQGTVTGGPDADTINLDPGAGHTADSLLLDGANGGDLYRVQFGRLDGPINIIDSGASGGDRAETNGTAPNEMFIVHNNVTNGMSPQTGGFVNNTTTSEMVTYTTTLESLLVHGQGGEDMFDVQPSQSTEITINGGSPTFGDPLPNGGDKLDFDSFGEYFFINGKTIETEGGDPNAFEDVNFRNIEQLPLDPLGPDSLFFDFDSYDNPTDMTLLSATETGYTSVPHFAEYGVTGSGTFGWLAPLTSSGSISEGAFDTGAGSTATQDDLLRDGHFSNSPETFQTDIANGWYLVSAKLGSDNFARDQMRITDVDSGRVFVDDINTAIGEFADVTFVVLVEDGTLTLEISDQGGDQFWTLNSLEVRPADLLTIGTPEFNAPLVGDGTTIDTLQGFEATPNTLITIEVTAGILLPSQDVSPDYAGVQVMSNASGEYSYQIQRPAGRISSLVAMREVTGEHTGCLVIDYEAPEQWLFDFNSTTSPLEAGYFSVTPDNAYTTESGIGWDEPLVPTGGLTEGAFERSTVAPADQADARIDGHFSNGEQTFTAEVAPGNYYVNATLGDDGYSRDQMSVMVNGVPLAASVSTAAGEFFHNNVMVAAPTGVIEVVMDDLGGDQFWTLNSLEIRRVPIVGAVTFNPVAGTPVADGTTVTTITGSASVPDGSLITVWSGGVIDGAVTTTAQGVYQAVQAEVTGGAFSFDFQHPTTAGSPTFFASSVDGAVVGQSSSVVTFAAPAFTRYDFNGSADDTDPSAIGVRASDVWTTGDQFGYLTSPREFQRSDTVSYSTTSIPFYRDGHWQSGARTFRFAVDSPGDTVDVQVYVGDRSFRRDQVQVTAEDGTTDTQLTAAASNTWQLLTLLGVTDTSGDGFVDITFDDLGGDRYWAIVGVDVADPGMLPAAAPQLAEFVGGNAAAVSLEDLDVVRDTAIQMWADQGASTAELQVLRNVPIEIRDLDSHGYLGLSYHSRVLIDDNAAGAGWHLDVNSIPAAGNVDLLTTLLHEFGHQLGLSDQFTDSSDIMFGRLGTGEARRLDGDLGNALTDQSLNAFTGSTLTDLALESFRHESEADVLDSDTDAADFLIDVKRRREELDAHEALFSAEDDSDDEEDLI